MVQTISTLPDLGLLPLRASLMTKKTVSINIGIHSNSHKKLRMVAQKTSLTNGEIINGLLKHLTETEILELVKPIVEDKQREKEQRQLKSQIEAMSPERVKEILAILKKD